MLAGFIGPALCSTWQSLPAELWVLLLGALAVAVRSAAAHASFGP
jgi:hypothetical protein